MNIDKKENLVNLVSLVEQWAVDKGILGENGKGTPLAQHKKTIEEGAELMFAIGVNDLPEIIDAIGDVMVTLIIQSNMQQIDFIDVVNTAFGKNGSLTYMTTLDNMTAFLYKQEKLLEDNKSTLKLCCVLVVSDLINICERYELDLLDCLESAYNIISKRTGKMINGTFVKDV